MRSSGKAAMIESCPGTAGRKTSYWYSRLIVQIGTVVLACVLFAPLSQARTLRVVAFGDSLSAGYLLPAASAFPVVLERLLRKQGLDVTVDNAAVSGDTTSAGLERLDWAMGDPADLVVLELGANDMLRGVDPAITRRNLGQIIDRLKAKGAQVLLAGMLAAPGMGKGYEQSFAAIFPDLAREKGVALYPFFLQGVATDPKLLLGDGMHPNPAGVEVIATGILPLVVATLKQIAAGP